jgi:ABC-type multidrug transport system fused ATPase/permease subunit
MLSFSLRLVKPYWPRVVLIVIAMLLQTAARLAAPWPLKVVIDSVLLSQPIPPFLTNLLGGTDQLSILNLAVVATVLIAILDGLANYCNVYLTASIGQWIAHDLRQTMYAHLQRLSMSFYDRQQIGPIISTITDDIQAVQSFASSSLLTILMDVLTIIGILVVMFSLNWNFTLVALSVTPFLAIFAYRLRYVVKSATKDVRRYQSEIVSIVQEGLSAIRVVKAFAQGAFERRRLDAKSLETVQASLRARRTRAVLPAVMTVVVAIGTAAVLWFGGRLVLKGAMTAGALVVFLTYLGKLFAPIQDLARASNDVAQASVGLERIMAILETDERLLRSAHPVQLEKVTGQVEFRDVTFSYQPGRPVLQEISVTVQPGQMIGLVGPSGSGKSTLASLLPRFYDPTSGAILIDGQDIRDYSIRSLRRQIGFVLQDTQLFHASVSQNISYGRPEATQEEIVRAATIAHADQFIKTLPEGYDTIVGQGGLSLSGGQRQRLGIARALIRDAPIIVLDEPSSGLDAESEKLVFDALGTLLAGRTTFVIAHRLATIRKADLILVLDGGRIVERGTHDELISRSGLYASLNLED